MCLALLEGAQGILRGVGSLAEGRYQSAVARHEGKQARLDADLRAQQLARKGEQELAAIRRDSAGTGNASMLDFVADRRTALGQDIAWATYGGQVAQAEGKARAAYARQQGQLGFATHLLGAAVDLVRGVDQLSKFPII